MLGKRAGALPELCLSFEVELDLLAFLGGNRYLLFLGAVFFVPDLNGVVSGGQILQFKGAIVPGHCEIGVRDHAHVGFHPGMNVAFSPES